MQIAGTLSDMRKGGSKMIERYKQRYLAELESITYDEDGTVIFAESFYREIEAFCDEEACRVARRKYCFSSVNPYGEKTSCTLKAIYRKGCLYGV